MSTMATPVQPKVQAKQKKGSSVETKMGISPERVDTSLCCRYTQFKYQPGHSCRLSCHLSSSWNKWLLTQPCWVNIHLTTHTDCSVCSNADCSGLLGCSVCSSSGCNRSHTPPRSHIEFSWFGSSVVSLVKAPRLLHSENHVWKNETFSL